MHIRGRRRLGASRPVRDGGMDYAADFAMVEWEPADVLQLAAMVCIVVAAVGLVRTLAQVIIDKLP
jgi:hypothetical protein